MQRVSHQSCWLNLQASIKILFHSTFNNKLVDFNIPELITKKQVVNKKCNRKPQLKGCKCGPPKKRQSKNGDSSKKVKGNGPTKRITFKFPEIPVKMKKGKIWVPDPEFIKDFEGMLLYPDDETGQCKHYPYNGKMIAGAMKKVPKMINFGPCHPAAHGVLRLILQLDGEKIEAADPHIGLLHRGTEKLMEHKTYLQCLPYFDR